MKPLDHLILNRKGLLHFYVTDRPREVITKVEAFDRLQAFAPERKHPNIIDRATTTFLNVVKIGSKEWIFLDRDFHCFVWYHYMKSTSVNPRYYEKGRFHQPENIPQHVKDEIERTEYEAYCEHCSTSVKAIELIYNNWLCEDCNDLH